jgi:hypothetical protein
MDSAESPWHRSPISFALIIPVHLVEEDAGVCPELIGIDFHIDESRGCVNKRKTW